MYVNKIQDLINSIDLNNTPLCKQPDENWSNVYRGNKTFKAYTPKLLHGYEMQSYTVGPCRDEISWRFPKDMKEKIQNDDTLYKVWYDTYDAADPMDQSENNVVIYIEKINDNKIKIKDLLKTIKV